MCALSIAQIVCARARRCSAPGASFLASLSYCLKSADLEVVVGQQVDGVGLLHRLRRGVLAVFSAFGGFGVARVVVRDFFAAGAALVRFIAGDADLAREAEEPRDVDLPAADEAPLDDLACARARGRRGARRAAARRRLLRRGLGRLLRRLRRRALRPLRLRIRHFVGFALVQALVVGRAPLRLVVSHHCSSVGGRIAIDAPVPQHRREP